MAAAQRSQNWRWCAGQDWTPREQRLAACTAIIETRSETASNLAIAFCNRGMIHLDKKFTHLGKPDSTLAKEDIERAMADFDEAVRLDPGRYGSLVCRGHGYYAIGDFDRAIANYAQA